MAPADAGPLLAAIDQLESYDIAVFISQNAVDRTLNLLRARRSMPQGLRIAAVGRSTARALARHGLPAQFCPQRRFDSEALLDLPEMQVVSGLRIVLFRGDGGRELLADTLRRRGAQVECVEAYRRSRPAADVSALLQEWARGSIDVVTVTSGEALQNLFELVGKLGQQWLRRVPLVVMSERTAELARQLGFRGEVLVAEEASDPGLLSALVRWRTGVWTPADGATTQGASATPARGGEEK